MRAYVRNKMWNTTVTIKTPATFNEANFPLTYTDQEDIDARFVNKSVRNSTGDGTTFTTVTICMIDPDATVTEGIKIEHNSTVYDVTKIVTIYDDRNEVDHYELWTM